MLLISILLSSTYILNTVGDLNEEMLHNLQIFNVLL